MSLITAFFCSNACPGDVILKAQDWANNLTIEISPVMSGFHTAIERDVLRVLLRNESPIIYTLARSMTGARLPRVIRDGERAGYVRIVSPFSTNQKRTTAKSAHLRNEYILSKVDRVLIAHASVGGKTEQLAEAGIQRGLTVLTFHSKHNENLLSLGALPLTI